MAIVTSEKIFVDPKEEITTVIERALTSEKERVIFVIPQNSLLLSSAVTVNILFRELAKSKKHPIIVTEDDYGKIISQRAGFEVVAKVSQITAELWEAARAGKKAFIDKQEAKKKALLENMQGDEQIEEKPEFPEGSTIEENIPETKIPEAELTTEIPAEDQSEAAIPEILKEEESALKSESKKSEFDDIPQVSDEQTKVETAAEVEAKEDARLLKRYQKPRREAKIVNLDGIEVFSGGNIKSLQEPLEGAKIDANSDTEDISDDDNMEDFNTSTRRISQIKKASNFTGKDFTRMVNKENSISAFFKNLFTTRKIKDPSDRLDPLNQTNKLKKRLPVVILCVVAFLMLSGGYVLAFVVSSVDISLKLKKEDVAASAFVQVDPDITTSQVDATKADSIIIPGLILKQEKLSISKTGEANGQGRRGNKAKGVVTIYNKTLSPVTIKAGTQISSVTTNLKYSIKNDVNIKAAVKKPDNSIDTSDAKADDVPVEAVDIGTEYNITDSSSNTTFLVDGYKSSDLTVTRYLPFDGGSVETFTSVSKDNIETVKTAILPDLQTQAKSKLQTLIPQGYKLLDESIEFTETSALAVPAQDQESKDKTFSLTVEGTIQGIAIKNQDLEDAIKLVLENNQSTSTDQRQIAGIEDIQISKVEKGDGKKLVLTVSSKGSVSSTVTDEQIKKDLAGKTLDEARDYLNLIEQIESFKITFSPSIVPSGLQRIPTDTARVNIKTK